MPSAEESLMRILRANEYEDADREMQSLTEATNNLYKAIEKDLPQKYKGKMENPDQ